MRNGRAGRPTDRRSRSSPTRAAKRRSGWSRRTARRKPEQITTGGKALPLCARVGARRQAHRVQRQGRPALRRRRWTTASSPRSRTPRSAPIPITAGRRAAITSHSASITRTASGRSTSGARRDGKTAPCHQRVFQFRHPGVGSRRELPVLPQQSRFRAADFDGRVQLTRPIARPTSTPWRCART